MAFQLRFRPIEFVEINVLVAVAAGLINEPLAVPRKELDWVERFKIFAVAFFEEGGYERTVCCAVGIKLAMFLCTVELDEVDGLSVGSPGDIGEIAVGRVS